jgi:hypothetical protein
VERKYSDTIIKILGKGGDGRKGETTEGQCTKGLKENTRTQVQDKTNGSKKPAKRKTIRTF